MEQPQLKTEQPPGQSTAPKPEGNQGPKGKFQNNQNGPQNAQKKKGNFQNNNNRGGGKMGGNQQGGNRGPMRQEVRKKNES